MKRIVLAYRNKQKNFVLQMIEPTRDANEYGEDEESMENIVEEVNNMLTDNNIGVDGISDIMLLNPLDFDAEFSQRSGNTKLTKITIL